MKPVTRGRLIGFVFGVLPTVVALLLFTPIWYWAYGCLVCPVNFGGAVLFVVLWLVSAKALVVAAGWLLDHGVIG